MPLDHFKLTQTQVLLRTPTSLQFNLGLLSFTESLNV